MLPAAPTAHPVARDRPEVAVVVGTRPEAIKMAPLALALGACPDLAVRLVSTGQHRTMLDDAFALFGLAPDVELDVMARANGLSEVTAAVLSGLAAVFAESPPDAVLVHGDTGTAFAAALAAYHARVPVGHVEAGLRTGNLLSPWPEEGNRRLVGALAARHYAPTARARDNLLAENVDPRGVLVTGNTVIDALFWVRDNALAEPSTRTAMEAEFSFLDPAKRVVLVTGHRRENQDGGIERVCHAMKALAARGDVEVVYPVHLNPAVRDTVESVLRGVANVHLIAPLDYLPFVWLMDRSAVIVTDSGGIQEEAPSLGKPVLVARDTTERPEAVDSGVVRLIGTDTAAIGAEVSQLLDDPARYDAMAKARNPYGDGRASARIVDRLKQEAASCASA